MNTVKTKPGDSIISIRGLLLAYILLSILAIIFVRSYFLNLLQDGDSPRIFNLVILFTIPIVLLVFLGISIINLFWGLLKQRMGSKFQSRILIYFILTALLAGAPPTIITTEFFYEVANLWQTIRIQDAMNSADEFALDNYHHSMESLEKIAEGENLDSLLYQPGRGRYSLDKFDAGNELAAINENLLSVQDFEAKSGRVFLSLGYAGREELKLAAPPAQKKGFVIREIPRDRDLLRYVSSPAPNILRVVSYSLGAGFDEKITVIETEKNRIEAINSMRYNIKNLLFFYYGVFFFPTLLMTLIIAVSLSKMLTQPIAELAEATSRVAEGDFSIQIISRPRDELGLLIRSFNAMVRDLESSRNALLQAEKITIWQDMAQQLAHEIKNPLTPIRLSAERVLRRLKKEPERIGEILESSMMAIIQEVEGLSDLLTEFKSFAKPIEPSLSQANLAEVVEEIILPYRSSHPKVDFITTYVARDMFVRIGRRYLGHALTNLIINAIDAMDGAGRLEFRSDLVKKRDSYYCRISIKDSGKGIKDQDQSKVFAPYYTTKESGTGLGLPIVERIISDHSGAVWFNSAAGIGTTFFVDLPAVREHDLPKENEAAHGAGGAANTGGLT